MKKLTDIAMPRIGRVMIDALRGRTWMGLVDLLYPRETAGDCKNLLDMNFTKVNSPSCPLFVPHVHTSSSDQQALAVLQAATPLRNSFFKWPILRGVV